MDVAALVAAGGDLDRALADAPTRDAGFSPESLAWVLDTLPESALPAQLVPFRDSPVERLLRRAATDG